MNRAKNFFVINAVIFCILSVFNLAAILVASAFDSKITLNIIATVMLISVVWLLISAIISLIIHIVDYKRDSWL